MNRILFSVVVALTLTACATIKNPISKAQLDPVEASLGTGYTLLAEYRDLCAARQIPVTCRTRVPKLQLAATQAQGALIKARDLVDNHPEIDASTAISLATSAVSGFRSLLITYGVK